ncbi:MAG: FtsX-like permease family protein [Candidatus Aminicenantales bacterium]
MIKFLIKGLLRDRSRSLFPLLTVAIGVFLTVVFYCWMQGIVGDMLQTTARFEAGHVKVMSRAYVREADQIPNDLALLGAGGLLDELRRDHPSLTWTSRIRFGGLLDVPDEKGETKAQAPVAGLAVDLLSPSSPEPGILNLAGGLVRGRLPQQRGEILVSDDLAGRLGLGLGGTVTLIGSSMYGSLITANFTLAGTIRFGVQAIDRGMMVADLEDVRLALDMQDAAGEVLGFLHGGFYDDVQAGRLAGAFNALPRKADDPFSPVMETLRQQSGLGDMVDMMNTVVGALVAIFVLAMCVVLWNAGLMGNIRRYGEIGVRLAMGEAKGRVYRSMIGESLILGFIGSLAGTALGLALAYVLQANGINFGSLFEKATLLMSTSMRARVTPVSFIIGFVPGLLATLAGASIAGLGIFKRQTSRLLKELEA